MKKILLTILAFVVLATPHQSHALITSGLLNWYTMNQREMHGGRLFDLASTTANLTLTNIASTTFYTMGKLRQGFNFDGSNDYARTNIPPIQHGPSQPYTFAFWMYKNANVANQSNLFGGNGGSSNAWITSFLHNVTGTMFFRMCKENVDCRDTPISGVLPLRTWIHVAGVYDTSNTHLTLYINGASTTSRVANLTGVTTGTSQAMFIGSYKTPSLHFSGRMDEVMIWDRALSQQEVKDVFRYGASKHGR